jgi:hypothetical protein
VKLTRQKAVHGLAILVLAAAYGLNYWSLALVFEAAQFGTVLSWLAPLTVDGLGLTAMLVYDAEAEGTALRRYAGTLVVIALVVSAAGGAAHAALAEGAHVQLDVWERALGGAIPGACAAGTIHLLGLMRQRTRASGQAKPKPAPRERSVSDRPADVKDRTETLEALPAPANGRTPVPGSPAHDDAVVRGMMARGERCTESTVAAKLSKSKATAKRVMARVGAGERRQAQEAQVA